MADDFRVNVQADLDASEAEQKLNKLINEPRKIKVSLEIDKSATEQAKDLVKSIERGLKSTKLDTGEMAKQLAAGFNINNKNVVSKLKSQMDSMLDELAKSWNGKQFVFDKNNGFISGLDAMADTVSKNAKVIEDKMGIYDQFYSYFKDKKIYISDELKSAMGEDLYKEISNANIGRIVRDSVKGVSIDSIWDEMTTLFPEHFASNITNQVDQIVKAFDVLKAARADVARSLSFDDMTPKQQFDIKEQAYGDIVPMFNRMMDSLKANMNSASDELKSEFEIDVKVNKDSIISDIRSALSEASSASGEPVKIKVDLDKSEIETDIRNAVQGISADDFPVKIKVDIDKADIESELQAAVSGIDLPVQFRVDASDIESQIRAAVAGISNLEIDVQVNASQINSQIQHQVNQNPITIPVQGSGNNSNALLNNIQNINRAGQQGQDIFTAFGGTVRDAFSAYTLANLLERGIDKIEDAGRKAIETVKELDDASVQLQLATGSSRSEAKNMISGYRELGNELGNLTLNVAESADAWLRQGKSAEETNTLIADSVKLSTLGQINSADATEYLTSAMNGYGVAVEDVSKITDKLSSIDLVSATSAGGLAEAMSRTATSANIAGVSMDRLLAILATTGEVTQKSMSTIGESYKTIFARMRDIKAGNLSSVGEDGTMEDLSDVEIVLNSLGIKLRDSNQEFRNFQTVLDEVAAGWKNYSSVQQAAIAKAFAGQRQQENFLVLMENYDRVLKYTSVAANSEGATEEKFGAYLDSLEAKTNKLKNSLELLATDTITDELYSGFLEGATAASDFARETDLVKTALTGLGTAGVTYAITHLITLFQNTAAQVTALGGGLQGLWGVLSAHPVGLVTVGVTAAVGAWNAYQKSVQESVNSAKQAASEWEESNSSIQSNIDKITELRTALDSGTLTEQEAYDTKSQLLDIQNQLSESYGSQAEGIDLVNGSLDEQNAKLKELNIAQSERFLNENQKGIEKAQRQMEKERHTYLGQFSPYAPDADKLQSIIDKYKDKGVYTDTDMDGTVYIHFKGDATDANTVLNDIMTDLRAAADETGNTNLFDGFIQNASAGLNEAKDVLDEYQNLYNQSLKADIQTNKKDYGGKTAAEWLNNYAKAVENYNDAVANGSTEEVANAKDYYNKIDQSVQGLLKGSDMSQYSTLFDDVSGQLDKAAIKANEFNAALSSDGQEYLNGYQKHLRSVADEVKNLNMSDVDFKAAINSGDIDSINYLSQAAEQAGISTDDLAQALVNLGVLSGQSSAAVEEIADSFQSVSDSANTLLSQINTVNSVLSSQSTGKSISIEDFNSDELKDYTSALEYNNGVLQLNAEKVQELQKAKAEEAIQTNENQKLEKQSKYMENIAEIEKLQDELRNLNNAKGENAQAIQSSIDALLSENDTIVNQCSQLDILSASLREATGAYQNWLDKQNGSESGDMFDDAMSALNHIEDVTQNTKSDDYGRIGKKSYKAAVEFLVPDTIDSQDAEAVSSYIDSIEHYFNHDSKGNRTGLDVAEFCAKATKAGLMELDEATNEYKILGQRTMQDFADGLNLSLPMVQAMFGEMEEFGGQFDWADEAIKTLGDLGMAAGEAKDRLESINGNQDLNIQIDVSDIETTEDKISTLENTISQMQEYKTTLPVDSSEVDDANAIIQYCITQKQMLEAPTVMTIDASQVSGEIGNALSLLQQFQEAQNNVELQAAVGADTSEAQGQVDSLVSEIQGLNPEIKAQLGIDGSSEATITASIQGITPEILVKAGVDSDLVDAYAAEEKQSKGTVTWDNKTGKVDAWASQMHVSKGTVSWGNDISKVKTYFTATGHVNWENSTPPSGGAHGLNGTAHAGGTAHYPHLVGHANAKGSWGTKTGGMTLVGELGREIVVNPFTGTWETVGDNGAEFKYIPAGSIVFNHLQSESLLERGFVNSRGSAKASGTAMVSGGISVKQANVASGKTTYKGSTPTKTSTTATKQNTSAVNTNTKAVKQSSQAFDWIRVALDRAKSKVEEIASTITDFVSSAYKSAQLQKQITAIDNEIVANQKGYYAYLEKANAVAKKYEYQDDNDNARSLSIPSKYKKLVQNGTFSVEDMDTSTAYGKALAEAVQKYQEYYEAAQDCRRAVQELRTEQYEAFQELMNIPTEEAEKKIDKLERKLKSLTAVQSTTSMGGSAIAQLPCVLG